MSRRRDHTPPSTGPTEAEVLLGFLDYIRLGIVGKVEDAPEPEVRTAMTGSGTNLLGLVKHLTAVERFTFLGQTVRDWPATFAPTDTETIDGIVADYEDTNRQVDAYVLRCDDLTVPVNRGRDGPAPSIRWALTHMIEETARHAGHADILRELIDGTTGR
jgi:hypothetical protein